MNDALPVIVQLLQLSAVLFSVVLILRILLQKDRQPFSNWILLTFLILNSYGLLLFIFIDTGLISTLWYLYRTGLPTSLLVPALVYLYVRSVVRDEYRFQVRDAVHLIPFLIGFVQYAPYYFSSSEAKRQAVRSLESSSTEYLLDIGVVSEEVFAVVRGLISVFYAVLILRFLWQIGIKEQIQSGRLKSFEKQVLQWIRVFGITFSINHLAIFTYLILQVWVSSFASTAVESVIALFITLFFNGTLIYYSSYLLLRPETLIGLERNFRSSDKQRPKTIQMHSEKVSGDASSVDLMDNNTGKIQKDELEEDYQTIKEALESEKLYLDSTLQIQDVAQLVGLPVRRTSFVVNSYFGKNFNQLINEYRIREAIRRIEDGFLKEFTLDGLWEEVGFSNRTSFFRAFKEVTGGTPGQFVQQHEKGA